jgi:hypothetical protein
MKPLTVLALALVALVALVAPVHGTPVLALTWPVSASRPLDDSSQSPAYKRALKNGLLRSQARWRAGKDVWQDHSTWENAWVVRGQYYEVRMTGAREEAANLASGLDTMLGYFQTVLGIEYAPETPFQVYVFPGLTEYNTFGNANGAAHSSFYGSFYTNQTPERPVSSYRIGNPTRLGMWVTHAAFHQYLDHAFSQAPPAWISEGLAAFFELYWDYNWGLSQFDLLRSEERLLPLRRLLRENVAAYADQTEDRLVQLGVFFSYLIQQRGDTKTTLADDGTRFAPFIDYIRAYLGRRNPRGQTLHELFTADIDQLEQDFLAFEFPR